MSKPILLIIILLCSTFSVTSYSQRSSGDLIMRGTVMGYEHDPAKGLFKKESTDIEGSLSGASIQLLKSGKQITTVKTSAGGGFNIRIPIGKRYKIQYTKSGYGTSAFEVDLTNIPDEMSKSGLLLENMELILNSFDTDRPIDNGESFGRIYYDTKDRRFYFSEVEFETKGIFNKDEDKTPYKLIHSALEKNKSDNKSPIKTVKEEQNNQLGSEVVDTSNNVITTETPSVNSNTLNLLKQAKLTDIKKWEDLTNSDIENRTKQIEDAWDQLEEDRKNAVSKEDFILLKAREELLIAAENELQAAKAYIAEQEEKLDAQRNVIIFMIIGGVLLIAFVLFLLKSIKEKRAHNKLLAEKNQKIADSISYAERIQRSVLLSESQIKSIIPNSFVYHLPRDVVSGDFYWFSEVNGKIVMAAVDCTGHGVPGAFMSLIGNTLLNQIVNEKKIDQPADILKELHHGIVESLRQERDEMSAQDGMDLAVCTIDKKTNKLLIAGAMNPVYLVHDDEVQVISGDLKGIGGFIGVRDPDNISFKQHEFTIQKDSSIYLFSDGYMDQFGGDKDEKFNVPRFKALIKSIYKKPSAEQKVAFKTTMEEWKGDRNQIDDILVIGAKF